MTFYAVPAGTGWIEVITGCMFSGKTEELIRRLVRAQIARQRVLVFKPATDTRYAREDVVTHAGRRLACQPIARASEIPRYVQDAQVVGVDEAQFFDRDLVEVCNRLADEGRRVIVAGLDQDFQGRPFEPIPELLAVAEYITKNLAVCMVCGAPADRSQRLDPSEAQVLLGATDIYEARCRKHWSPGLHHGEQPTLPLTPRGATELEE
ncbi:MAG: thymidine kinase [Deltaproteobacteria bacterium]|nr:MAG: thymidine kinase [Deltaproteobacteria bacterium]